MFSDYSGDLGTIYNVPSESKVVGRVQYIPTPGATGVGSNLGNPDGIGIPAEAKHVAAAVAFIKWMEEPANQAAFAGADGTKYVIRRSRCRPTAAACPIWSSPARSPAPRRCSR